MLIERGASASSGNAGALLKTAAVIALDRIVPDPNQPRDHFDERAHEWLTESVAQDGVLQPILVRPVSDGHYMIIDGERRYRAASKAGLTRISTLVVTRADGKPLSDAEVRKLALIQNLQRSDTGDYEVAVGIAELLRAQLGFDAVDDVAKFLRRMYNKTLRPGETELAATTEATFRQLGRNWRSFTTTHLIVFSLRPELRVALRARRLDLSKARALNRVTDNQRRRQLMEMTIAESWTTARLKQEVTTLLKTDDLKAERRRVEIAKRMTVIRNNYVKARRRLPTEALEEIEGLVARITELILDGSREGQRANL